MCGRYNIHDDPWLQSLMRELGIEMRLPARSNIAPTEPVPVVFQEEGERQVQEMRWWLVPSWAPRIDASYSMFNAKSETLTTSKAFRGPFRHRRCILPASSFVEWTQAGGQRQPWLIRPQDRAIAFAGLWDIWENDGNSLASCTIITTRAAPGIDRLHTRMPVMLQAQDFDRWLDTETPLGDATELFRPVLRQPFVIAPLSTAINNARHKGESLMAPTGPEEILPGDGAA